MAGDGWGDDQGAARWGKIGDNPTDHGKTGTKRSLLTDGNGIPLGIEVAEANRHDSRLVEATLKSIPIKRPKVRPYHRQHLCWTPLMSAMKWQRLPMRLNTPCMFDLAAKRPRRCVSKSASKRDVGAWRPLHRNGKCPVK